MGLEEEILEQMLSEMADIKNKLDRVEANCKTISGRLDEMYEALTGRQNEMYRILRGWENWLMVREHFNVEH